MFPIGALISITIRVCHLLQVVDWVDARKPNSKLMELGFDLRIFWILKKIYWRNNSSSLAITYR
jgi:hypothetical protein